MGRTALVTGASSGFGLEFARLLARDGYDLVLAARSEDKLKALKRKLEKQYGVQVRLFVRDLSEETAAGDLFAFTKEEGLFPEVLINNAGFGDYGLFSASDLEKQTRMVNLNDRTLMQLTRLFVPAMIREGRGRILNVASIAGFMPGPMMTVYYASKTFVLSFTEGLARELKGTGVTVTALCPGPSDTGFVGAAAVPAGPLADLFKGTSARDVARAGYKAMMQGRVVLVPGPVNKAMASSVRFAPRGLVREILWQLQKRH